MKKGIYLSVLALSALVFSCKKDDDKKPAQELILGKWNYTGWTDNDFYGGQPHRDTGVYAIGTRTREFLNNGLVVDKAPTWVDTMAYKFEGGKLLTSSNRDRTKFDTLTIKAISETDLHLYGKEVESNGDYYEFTETYKK